jgi:uncharacterized protein (TIGR00255 family)
MKSMTSYAFEERQEEAYSLSVEMRGYNSRFLEVFINLSPPLATLEPEIREYVAGRFRRGKIEVNLRFHEYNAAIRVFLNREALKAYGEALNGMADTLGINQKPGIADLLGMEGVLEVEKSRDPQRYWLWVEPVLRRAADKFCAERNREGKHTEEDIFSHLAVLESSVRTIAAYGPALEAALKENLRARFAELLGSQIDENRILAETAVLLMKYTISEEISRLASHLGEFRAEAERNPSPGKKLDFLCQEINREINTIGSKTPMLEVSRAVVDMKDALENIREQLRNVE